MIVIKGPFRCDLCGKHRSVGVTETEPKDPTTVCSDCIASGVSALLNALDDKNEPTPETPKDG